MKLFERNSDRIFLIANGPSLRETPLELLKDEDTMGMNRIHLLYPDTDWRPTFFFMIDHNTRNQIGYWKDCINANISRPKYLWRGFRDGIGDEEGLRDVELTSWMDRCQRHHYYRYDNIHKRVQSWHLPELCTGIGGLSAMMQIAVLMGYEEIYLVGADMGYTSDVKSNHFSPEYSQYERAGWEVDNASQEYLHEMAFRSSPVPIYNATVGGNVEVYERRKLEDVINGNVQKRVRSYSRKAGSR